jgi:hypothetical protein
MSTNACQLLYDCKELRRSPKTKTPRLLRILLLRVGTVSADPAR